MRRVVLANSSVNDAGIARLVPLPRLEIPDLSGTKVTNAAVDHLEKMVCLRELNVENTSLNSSTVARLQKALPKCDIRSGRSGKSGALMGLRNGHHLLTGTNLSGHVPFEEACAM